MTSPARVREPELLAEQMAALCAESKRTASEFALGALDALQWLTQGGPGPLTTDIAQSPVTVRAVVHELAAAEAVIYGRRPSQREYARGVEHALMWAQYATAAPPVPLESKPSASTRTRIRTGTGVAAGHQASPSGTAHAMQATDPSSGEREAPSLSWPKGIRR